MFMSFNFFFFLYLRKNSKREKITLKVYKISVNKIGEILHCLKKKKTIIKSNLITLVI